MYADKKKGEKYSVCFDIIASASDRFCIFASQEKTVMTLVERVLSAAPIKCERNRDKQSWTDSRNVVSIEAKIGKADAFACRLIILRRRDAF